MDKYYEEIKSTPPNIDCQTYMRAVLTSLIERYPEVMMGRFAQHIELNTQLEISSASVELSTSTTHVLKFLQAQDYPNTQTALSCVGLVINFYYTELQAGGPAGRLQCLEVAMLDLIQHYPVENLNRVIELANTDTLPCKEPREANIPTAFEYKYGTTVSKVVQVLHGSTYGSKLLQLCWTTLLTPAAHAQHRLAKRVIEVLLKDADSCASIISQATLLLDHNSPQTLWEYMAGLITEDLNNKTGSVPDSVEDAIKHLFNELPEFPDRDDDPEFHMALCVLMYLVSRQLSAKRTCPAAVMKRVQGYGEAHGANDISLKHLRMKFNNMFCVESTTL
jgi:hypothetical protein